VNEYIIPWTQGIGCGYALLVNRDEPKEVNLMVSHAWSENAEVFLETLCRSAAADDVMFVCALAIYQAKDGVGPSIAEQLGSDASDSPFRRVLEHIRHSGLRCGWRWRHRSLLEAAPRLLLLAAAAVFFMPCFTHGCIPGWEACASFSEDGRTWCWRDYMDFLAAYRLVPPLALALACSSAASWNLAQRGHHYRGRMMVVPNRESDLYQRLWCVYEIFVAKCVNVPVVLGTILASAGTCSSREANCSSKEDKDNITGHIIACNGDRGFERIDSEIHRTTRGFQRAMCVSVLREGIPAVLGTAAVKHVRSPGVSPPELIGGACGMLGAFLVFALGFYCLKQCQGSLTGRAACLLEAGLFMIGIVSFATARVLEAYADCSSECACLCFFLVNVVDIGGTALLFGAGYFGIFLLVLSKCRPCMKVLVDARFRISAFFVLLLLMLQFSVGMPRLLESDQLWPSVVFSSTFVYLSFAWMIDALWVLPWRWGLRIAD